MVLPFILKIGGSALLLSSHIVGLPSEQLLQFPHDFIRVTTTRSPISKPLTVSPILLMKPAASWPYTAGKSPPQSPSANDMSEWHTATAPKVTSTSPVIGSLRSIVSILRGAPNSWQTAALIFTIIVSFVE